MLWNTGFMKDWDSVCVRDTSDLVEGDPELLGEIPSTGDLVTGKDMEGSVFSLKLGESKVSVFSSKLMQSIDWICRLILQTRRLLNGVSSEIKF